MVYLRVIIGSQPEKWLDNTSVEQLAREIFREDEDAPSFYNIDLQTHEARATAAHYLTLNRGSVEKSGLYVLRFVKEDLDHLEVKSDLGRTGVDDIDRSHVQVVIPKEARPKMCASLRDSLQRGQDRIRKFDRSLLRNHVAALARADATGVSSQSAAIAKKLTAS